MAAQIPHYLLLSGASRPWWAIAAAAARCVLVGRNDPPLRTAEPLSLT